MMRVVLFLVLASLLATPVGSQAQSGPQWIDVEGADGAKLRAAVSIAGSFRNGNKNDPPALSLVQDLGAPLLILHGTSDTTVPVQRSREYEARARELGKNIEAYYIEGGNHFMWSDPKFKDDVLRRSVEFLDKYLRP